MIGRREEREGGVLRIWAVRFWFGEFQEEAVCTPYTDRKRAQERERGGKREKDTLRVRKREKD